LRFTWITETGITATTDFSIFAFCAQTVTVKPPPTVARTSGYAA